MTAPNQTLDEYDRWMLSWGAAGKTREARLRFAGIVIERWPDLRSVTTDDLTDWLASDGLKQWSRATYFNHLRSFFGWLAERGTILADPTARMRRPKSPGGQPKPLSNIEQAKALMAANRNERAWLLLALLAGLRAHEIAKIRGEDVAEDFVYVKGKGGKESFIPTHPDLWSLAEDYPRTGWWFPSPRHDGHISSDSVTILTGKLFRKVGIESGSIHRARHSYATSLLRGGANMRVVQGLMRHASLATTALYCAVDEDERRAAVNLLGSTGTAP